MKYLLTQEEYEDLLKRNSREALEKLQTFKKVLARRILANASIEAKALADRSPYGGFVRFSSRDIGNMVHDAQVEAGL